MSDYKDLSNSKELTDNDDNSDSTKSSTTTSIITSNTSPRNSSILISADTKSNPNEFADQSKQKEPLTQLQQLRRVQLSVKSARRLSLASQNSEKNRRLTKMSSSQRSPYEIEQVADDQYDENDFLNDDYYGNGAESQLISSNKLIDDIDTKGIVDYFNESELQPTTADMILGFEPSKALELPSPNIFENLTKPLDSINNSGPNRQLASKRSIKRTSVIRSNEESNENYEQKNAMENALSSTPKLSVGKKLSTASTASSNTGNPQLQMPLKSNMKKTGAVIQQAAHPPLSLLRTNSIVKPSSTLAATRQNSKSVSSERGSVRLMPRTTSIKNYIKRANESDELDNSRVNMSVDDYNGRMDRDDMDNYRDDDDDFDEENLLDDTDEYQMSDHQKMASPGHRFNKQDSEGKKIKNNLTKQQIQQRQHVHQYPHPQSHFGQEASPAHGKMLGNGNGGGGDGDDGGGFNMDVGMNRLPSSASSNQQSGYVVEKSYKFDYWGSFLIGISYFLLVISFPFSLCTCVKVAQEYERAVIFRLGRIYKGGAKGPGIFFVLPCVDTYTKVDLRTVTFDVPPQEILTKDSVTVSVDAVVYFRIFNAVISVINVEDAAKSTKLLAASTLRNILGTKSLHEILSDRESVAILIQTSLDEATEPWKDVRLPVQLQRAMATEAEAAREARAKVIAAEGEQKASKALKEAAIVISESPIAIQLRYMQTLTQIASEKNSTIVFPIPLEMLSFLANKTLQIFRRP